MQSPAPSKHPFSPLPMSPAISPPRFNQDDPQSRNTTSTPSTTLNNTSTTTTLPIHRHKFPPILLRLQLHDLAHDGSSIFLSNVKGAEDFSFQVQSVLNLLYHTPTSPRPGTRSVTLILRAFDGVAYTTGIALDDDHKEIHLNTNYLKQIPPSNQRPEILGVLCHELVHCFQWNAGGTCNGGLIEGIADWVRLNAGLGARHWRREKGGEWDRGYQHTGFFLQWLEERFGEGTVRAINAGLRTGEYDEGRLFGECCGGRTVGELWEEYVKSFGEEGGDGREEGMKPVPTHTAKQC